MRVFIVNPSFGDGFVKTARWFAKSRGRVQRHPDYLARATAVLEAAGHECKFLDAQAKDMPPQETTDAIRAFRPDLVVVYATTPSILSDLEHTRLAREATGGALTVMVGSHVSAEPEDTLRRGAGYLDAVTRREYDYTLREVADRGTVEGVAGLSRLADGDVVHEAERPMIEDMDSLPFPAWHHIDIMDYHDAGKLYPFITLIGGRGCPAKCTFCQLPQVMYGHRYRTHSPARVLDEIEYDLDLFPNLREVMFEDDTLTLSTHQDRLREICQGIIDRGLNRKISWSCNARPDLTDLDTLKLMKESGARMFCTGFEFGNDEMLKRIKKGIGTEKMREYAQNAKRAGIRIHGCFMIGGPGETRETAMQTIRFAQELDIDTCQFTGVAAYPGTSYYEWAKRNGYVVASDWGDWVDEDREQRGVVDVPGLSMREIEELVDLGLKSFYLRPKQMKTIAGNIRNLSDVKTKLHGLKSFVDYFGKSRKAAGERT
ncbi:MAG: radical SAM protein [bacterium]